MEQARVFNCNRSLPSEAHQKIKVHLREGAIGAVFVDRQRADGAVIGDQWRHHHRLGAGLPIRCSLNVYYTRVGLHIFHHLGNACLSNVAGDALAECARIGVVFISVFPQRNGRAHGFSVRLQQAQNGIARVKQTMHIARHALHHRIQIKRGGKFASHGGDGGHLHGVALGLAIKLRIADGRAGIGRNGADQAHILFLEALLLLGALHAQHTDGALAHLNGHAQIRERLVPNAGCAQARRTFFYIPVQQDGLTRFNDLACETLA